MLFHRYRQRCHLQSDLLSEVRCYFLMNLLYTSGDLCSQEYTKADVYWLKSETTERRVGMRSIQRQRRSRAGTRSWRRQPAETWAVPQWLGSDLQHLLGRSSWCCEGQLKSQVQSKKKKQLLLVHSRKGGQKGRKQLCFKLEMIKIVFSELCF